MAKTHLLLRSNDSKRAKVAAHYWNEDKKQTIIKGYQAALQLKKHEHTHRTLLDYLNQMESKPQEMESHVNNTKDYPESIHEVQSLLNWPHGRPREEHHKAGQAAERTILEDPNALHRSALCTLNAADSRNKRAESKLKEAPSVINVISTRRTMR